jgi:hypothetical protein
MVALSSAMGVCARAGDEYVIDPAKQEHWAWKRPVRATIPTVRNQAWPVNPIDYFVLAKLEAAGLEPAPPASREQLIRRVAFDLIGMPPAPAEIEAFVQDPSANAYEKVIDRLLESPHYGERWGRHWLDVARFAESNGYEYDEIRPDAWRYRDYVIQSFNADKPYDRFIREQIAGDELYPNEPAALVATGFNLLGPDMTDSSDQAQRRQNTLNDMTDTTALAFLGMTLGCARCHDHKFEPIPQTDYYRLQAFFAPAVFRKDLVIAGKDRQAEYERANREYQSFVKPLQEESAKLEAPYRKLIFEKKLARLSDEAQLAHHTPPAQRTGAQQELVEKTARLVNVSTAEIIRAMKDGDKARHKQLHDEIKRFDPKKPTALPVAMGLQDMNDRPVHTFLLGAGELGNRGQEVQPGYPIVLIEGHKPTPAKIETPMPASTGRRSALAQWIADKNNPLTARVLVNRLWQHHFGRGIVRTASDFGVRGEPPTHPELLDRLAVEVMRPSDQAIPKKTWSIKRMHRLMLLSATYQQSSRASPEALAKDPENHLFSRMNRLRLEGEIIRDSLLSVSGRLNLQMGGPGTFPPVPAEAVKGSMSWNASQNPQDHARRSVYIFARRNLRFPFLENFDLPDSNLSCPKRERSTTAPQALTLLNAQDVVDAAKAFATRLMKEATTQKEQIILGYRLALGRRPTTKEMNAAAEFLQQSPLSELCRSLFNLNEFVYLD